MAVVYKQALGPSRDQEKHDYIGRAEIAYVEMYNILISNPQYVADNLYRSQPGKSELSGSLLSVDDKDICCLVDSTIKQESQYGEPLVVNNTNTINNLCQADIRRLNVGGKLAKPLLAVYDDQRMVIKMSKVEPRVRWLNIHDYAVIQQLLTRGQLSNDEMNTFECWNPRADNLMACDNFSNDIIIGRLIASIFSSREAPGKTFNSYWAAALCQKDVGWIRRSIAITGLVMMEYADYGPINKLIVNSHLWAKLSSFFNVPGGLISSEVNWDGKLYSKMKSFPIPFVNGIFLQVAAAYDFLYQTHQFTHGDAKVSNILISSHHSNFTYRGVTVDCPVTVKITDFSKSSISIIIPDSNGNGIGKVARIFSYDRVAEVQLKLSNFQPKLQIINNRRVYRLSGVLEIVKLSKIRHGGLPFFRSFDIYTAFTSMLMLPEFLIPMLNDELLRVNLWDKLWLDEDKSQMEQRLWNAALNKVEPTYSNVLTILDGIYLYCDLADTMFSAQLNI